MNRYAIVYGGVVIGVALWNGEDEWAPENGEAILLTEENEAVSAGWTYENGKFIPPVIPPKPDEEIISDNTSLKANLLAEANIFIEVLTDATDPDIMGDDIIPEDVTNLKLWKAYRVQLSRVTDMLNPVWPKQPNA